MNNTHKVLALKLHRAMLNKPTFSDDLTGVDITTQLINDELYIMYHGSDEFMDWVTNLHAEYKTYQNVKIHHGYLKAYNKSRDFVEKECARDGVKKVYLTGHSAGGAVAQIQYYFKPDTLNAECVVFASPKPFKDATNQEIFLYENKLDLVPYLPFSYNSASKPIMTKKGFYHGIFKYYENIEDVEDSDNMEVFED